MSKKILTKAGIILAVVLTGCLPTVTPTPTTSPTPPSTRTGLTEAEAKTIAEASCIKGGEALSSGGTYNENSKTWWFDANLNATRAGCNPACVVSEETKTAEINWRCTGLNPDAEVATRCTDVERKADVCAQVLQPVCATVEIQCIKAPCNPIQQTFNNACEACRNPLVKSYTSGACTSDGG